jgi:serpin B
MFTKYICFVTLAITVSSAATAQAGAPYNSIDPSIQATAHASNQFAIDLYHQLRSGQGNLFFSPYSIDNAMVMVHAGAVGATADEIARTLKLPPLPPFSGDAAMAGLSRMLGGDAAHNGSELHVANAMWGQIGDAFSPSYVNRLRVSFGADLVRLDFSNPQGAAATINQWVSNRTNGLITDLIDPAALGPATRLILTNAIYFKGTWVQAFDANHTSGMPWNDGSAATAPASPPSQATVPMMFQTGAFDFVDGTDASALQMQYAGGDLSMLVLLPHDPAGLGALEKTLNLAKLKSVLGRLQREPDLELWFPKFKLDSKFNLRESLVKMGMPTAFSNHADFSGIDGTQNLAISEVVHRAFVSVDETGTEAAAATGAEMSALGGPPPPSRPVFRADHPFIFLIMDHKAGTILFMGRVVHPG